jgi:hypothetical protein
MQWMAMGAAAVLATPATAQLVVKSDGQWASEGEYLAYASPWCREQDRSLVAGRDYADTLSWQAGRLPQDVQIAWRWPAAERRPARCGVWGYDFVAWGNYEGGATLKRVAPRQVRTLRELSFAYRIEAAADPSAYNGLIEFYLHRGPKPGEPKMVEIGWFWHAPPATRSWAAAGESLGRFTDRSGRGWDVRRHDKYVTFIPDGAAGQGTIDAKGALDFLKAKGAVEDGWWFNGAAIGVEPLGGFGTAVIRAWQPTLR